METVKTAVTSLLSNKKILFVLTSADKFTQGSVKGKPTGYYLPELAHPYYVVTSAGYTITMASPQGGAAPLDPSSVEAFKDDAECTKFLNDSEAQQAVKNTVPLISINNITGYDAVFYVGGHGPCFDLWDDVNSIDLIQKFVASEKPVSAVCHGPVVFTKVKAADGTTPFVKGRRVTCFTDEEERQAKLEDAVPFLVETKLRDLGATFESADAAWGEHVVRDGHLITGQNPASAAKTARVLLEAIAG